MGNFMNWMLVGHEAAALTQVFDPCSLQPLQLPWLNNMATSCHFPIGETLSSTPFFGVWSSKWTVQGICHPAAFNLLLFPLQKESSRTKEIPPNSIQCHRGTANQNHWMIIWYHGICPPSLHEIDHRHDFQIIRMGIHTSPGDILSWHFCQINGWLFAKPRHIDMWNLDFPHSTKEQKLPNMDRVLRASSLGMKSEVQGRGTLRRILHIYIYNKKRITIIIIKTIIIINNNNKQ